MMWCRVGRGLPRGMTVHKISNTRGRLVLPAG